MLDKLKVWFRNNLEIISSLALALLITCLVFLYRREEFTTLYHNSNIGSTLIDLFGSLLGLLLTAYAIVFALVPTLKKDLLNSKHFLRINFLFLLSILSAALLLFSGIASYFVSQKLLGWLLIVDLFFFLLLIELVILLGIILFLLFKISRNDIIHN